jgi:hypothetical protein
MKTAGHLLELLYEALVEPIGLTVATPDWDKLRQQLYQARVKARDPALAGLIFRASPFVGAELIIVHSRPDMQRASPHKASDDKLSLGDL